MLESPLRLSAEYEIQVHYLLTELLESLPKSPALENEFYSLWTESRLSVGAIAIFVRNYGEFIRAFPDTLAQLVVATNEISAKTEYAKTLYSELGYGDPSRSHVVLFDRFFEDLAFALSTPRAFDRERVAAELELLPTTQAFISGQRELYTAESQPVAAGAQLALEGQAYGMLAKLYEGARLYMDLWPEQTKFHEACEYFYAHIASAEKDHVLEATKAAEGLLTSERATHELRSGFDQHLDLIAGFWGGVARSIGQLKGADQ